MQSPPNKHAHNMPSWASIPTSPVLPPPQPSRTSVPQSSPQVSPFWTTFGLAMRYGCIGGLACGCGIGTIIPIIGNLYGLGIGLIIGAILGFINGLVMGLVTWAYFHPLKDADVYRCTMHATGFFTSVIASLVLWNGGSNNHSSAIWILDFISFRLTPFVIVIYSLCAVNLGVNKYLSVNPPIFWLPPPSPYEADYLQTLFDEMRDSYERVSDICSFGFNRRWRRQLIGLLDLQPGMRVWDAMSGSGETWRVLLPRIGKHGSIVAVDFAPAMVAAAHQRIHSIGNAQISVYDENALHTSLPGHSVDALVCAYGLKTLTPGDQVAFASELLRVLKPCGIFGIVEIAAPRYKVLRVPYELYLRYVVPVIGTLLLGNPTSYRMLGQYVRDFDGGTAIAVALEQHGCTVHRVPLFGGCAIALIGMTPGKY